MMRLPMVGRVLGVRRKERIIELGWLHRYVVQSATLKSIGTPPLRDGGARSIIGYEIIIAQFVHLVNEFCFVAFFR